MGFVERLLGRRVYLDANVFIYALEGEPHTKELVTPFFAALDAGDIDGVTSDLTLAEVLVYPYRTENAELVDRYERLLSPTSNLTRVPVTLEVWREAARLRGETQIKLPDAVHLATAEAERCEFVVTNDKGIAKMSSIPVVLVDNEET